MATLNTTSSRSGSKSKTLAPSIDLTAMVDLAFLLITFFMLTTSLSKYNALDVAKPIDSNEPQPYPASRTMTIILGSKHQAGYFLGEAGKAKVETTGISTLSKTITSYKRKVSSTQSDKSKGMIVVIKPSSHSTYKDLVDVLDEMKINGIEQYTIDDKYFQEAELAYLSKNS